MAEYIEREAVKAEFKKNFAYGQNENFAKWLERVACETVDEIPSVDVQPVKHGKWIDCTFYDPCERNCEQDFEFKCSNCGHKIYNKPNDNNLFCGHCSAKMDGGAENGNAEG